MNRTYSRARSQCLSPTFFNIMKNLLALFFFNVLCLSVQGATLEFAFQLGEKQEPRFDRLLPDVARQMAFNKDSTGLIVKQMDGTVVMWDVQTRQNRIVCTVPESGGLPMLLMPINSSSEQRMRALPSSISHPTPRSH